MTNEIFFVVFTDLVMVLVLPRWHVLTVKDMVEEGAVVVQVIGEEAVMEEEMDMVVPVAQDILEEDEVVGETTKVVDIAATKIVVVEDMVATKVEVEDMVPIKVEVEATRVVVIIMMVFVVVQVEVVATEVVDTVVTRAVMDTVTLGVVVDTVVTRPVVVDLVGTRVAVDMGGTRVVIVSLITGVVVHMVGTRVSVDMVGTRVAVGAKVVVVVVVTGVVMDMVITEVVEDTVVTGVVEGIEEDMKTEVSFRKIQMTKSCICAQFICIDSNTALYLIVLSKTTVHAHCKCNQFQFVLMQMFSTWSAF